MIFSLGEVQPKCACRDDQRNSFGFCQRIEPQLPTARSAEGQIRGMTPIKQRIGNVDELCLDGQNYVWNEANNVYGSTKDHSPLSVEQIEQVFTRKA